MTNETDLLRLLQGLDAHACYEMLAQRVRDKSAGIAGLLLQLLDEGCPVHPMELAKLLIAVSDSSHIRPLLHLFERNPDPEVRKAAAHVLTSARPTPEEIDSVVATLAGGALSDANPSAVRGAALESLGHIVACRDRRRTPYRQAAAAVIEALGSHSAEVRFWACFAAGTMNCQAAAPVLLHIAESDPEVLDGWWAVAAEASDALAVLQGGSWPASRRSSS